MKKKTLIHIESFGKAWYSCIASREIFRASAREAYDDERASLRPRQVELILARFCARSSLNWCYRLIDMRLTPSASS